jgi:putative transposase
MSTQRKRSRAEFKARAALEALKGPKTVNEFARLYGGHPTPLAHGKPRLQKARPEIFSARRAKREDEQAALQAQLYPQIGHLTVEVDWLKKKLAWSPEAQGGLIEPDQPPLSLARQCARVGLSRARDY